MNKNKYFNHIKFTGPVHLFFFQLLVPLIEKSWYNTHTNLIFTLMLYFINSLFIQMFFALCSCFSLPCVVDFVSLHVLRARMLLSTGGCFQLPVIQTVQEHLSQVIHSLPFPLGQVSKLVHHKICHSLLNMALINNC